MSYTVSKLVSNAYYISGIVSRDFQTVSGSQFEDGLQALNEIIGDKVVEDNMVPYYSHYTFPGQVGVEQYFVPNLIEIETLVFFIQDIRYEMTPLERRRYRGSSRANNIESLPFTYNVERQVGGALISLYFLPNVNYPLEAWGLFSLPQVYLNQDLMNSLCTVQLGAVNIAGPAGVGTLLPGNFVINGTDMAGLYATPQALAVFINNQNIGVTAQVFLGQMTLVSASQITLATLGTETASNHITFTNFSTIDNVAKNQTYFPIQLDQFYITYLKYALAVRLCCEFDYVIPPGVQKQLDKYMFLISKRSQQLDLRMEKVSTLGTGTGISYGQVNLGHGWTI